MTFLQLVQRLRQEAGASGTGPVTVVNQDGELARMVNWINDAWLDIQSQHKDWGWMRTTCTFPTVTSKGTYSAADAGISDFGMWVRDSFRNYANPAITFTIASPCVAGLVGHGLSVGDTAAFATSGVLPTGITAGTTYYVVSVPTTDTFTFSATAGGSPVNTSGTQSGAHSMTSNNTTIFAGLKSEVFMDYDDYDTWRDSYLYGALRLVETRPMRMSIAPNKSLCLGPIPVAGYTILGDYFRVPSYMAADADIPGLPSQYHMAIVYKALISYGEYEESPAVVQRGTRNFTSFMRRLTNDRLPEVELCGALA